MESLPLIDAVQRDFPHAPDSCPLVEYHIGLAINAYVTIEVDRGLGKISNIGVRTYDIVSRTANKHWLYLDDAWGADSPLYRDVCSVLLAVDSAPGLNKMMNINVWHAKSATEVVGVCEDAGLAATVRRVAIGLTAVGRQKLNQFTT